MAISNQGFKFKLYLEGVLTPFLGASLTYQGYVPTAVIDMFPSKNFKDISSGTLVHIFYKALGTKEDYKLIFFGYVSGKNMQIQADSRNYALTAYGRLGMLHSIVLGTALNYTNTASKVSSLRYGTQLSQTEAQSAYGTALLKSNATIQQAIKDHDVASSLYFNYPTLNQQQSATGDATSKENITQDNTATASPAGNLAATVSISNPDMLKQAMLGIIADACNSSHIYYATSFYYRYFIEKLITEMPPTWTGYMAQWKPVDKIRFTQAVDNMIAASLGGMSSLAKLIDILLEFFFSEMWEVPGLGDGACVIMPELLQSDIPACNMILPSERVSFSIQDNDANRITRVITQSHPYTLEAGMPADNFPNIDGTTSSSNKSVNLLGIAIYPDVFAVAKDALPNNNEIKVLDSYIIKNEEYIGSRIKTMPYPADYLHTNLDGVRQQDVTEQIFHRLKDIHMSISVSMPFSPCIIPGLRAVIFDKHSPMIFKVSALAHRISNDGSAQTQIQGTSVEYLDNATLRHPRWYDQAYKPDSIHEIYRRYFGCTSMSESADKPGKLREAYDEIYAKYESSETKSYMAEVLSQRHMDTEKEIFKAYEAGSGQDFDAARDGDGVLIYRADAFDNYKFEGYDYDMNKITLINDRQNPVINYVKTIYGIIGDLYE